MINYYGQLVIGPSGSGKSTYCHVVSTMANDLKRNIAVINLDPAAEYLPYSPVIDIRELISLDDVMEELKLGPNGGLVYCLEFLLDNLDWLEEKLTCLIDDDYVLFDCPGQVELFSHFDVMRKLGEALVKRGFALVSVSLLDATFISDEMKFLSGSMLSLSFIVSLGLPAISVLSKCDLCQAKTQLKMMIAGDNYSSSEEDEEEMEEKAEKEKIRKEMSKNVFRGDEPFALGPYDRSIPSLRPGKKVTKKFITDIRSKISKETSVIQSLIGFREDSGSFASRFQELKDALKEIVEDYSLVQFTTMDISKENSIIEVIYKADHCIQFGENLEPKEEHYQHAERYLNQKNDEDS